MITDTLQINQRGSQTLDPLGPRDLVPLAFFNEGIASYAPIGHVHTSADITDFNVQVSTLVALGLASGVPMPALQVGGGLTEIDGALALDSGVASLVGHQHSAADIVDLAAAIQANLSGNLLAGDGLQIAGTGPFTLSAKAASAGGILTSPAGLALDFGSGTNQVARGDHTHSQLHNPVTLGSSSSLTGSVSGQTLSLEVRCVPGGGVLLTPSGLEVDPAILNPGSSGSLSLSVTSSATVMLGLTGGVLTASVPLDTAPPAGNGKVTVGVNGLRIPLGSTSDVAAPGNHVHQLVNSSGTDGFMSSTDKARLDSLWATPGGIEPISTATVIMANDGGLLSSTVQFYSATLAGSNRAPLGSDAGGLFVPTGMLANQAAPGNIVALMLGLESGIGDAVAASGTAPTQTEFNNLVAKVNSILQVLRHLGLPT